MDTGFLTLIGQLGIGGVFAYFLNKMLDRQEKTLDRMFDLLEGQRQASLERHQIITRLTEIEKRADIKPT